MKTTTIIFLSVWIVTPAVADEPMFPTLPDSPAKLIEILKKSGDRYTVLGPLPEFVKESDLPTLVNLLDSTEPCAFVDLSISSIYYPGRSTVGHEAAYLIEGFWKRHYPTGLTSQQYKPNVEEIKRWYRMWTNLKKVVATSDLADAALHSPSQPHVSDEVPLQAPGVDATVHVLVCPRRRCVFRSWTRRCAYASRAH